ncbi:lytic transglycosylase domain-containing protein [Aurantimonas sp. C2-6-R+9]|nr:MULTISPECIES: lytic transglycosylase domain-containing protein [unclassified Aurantimonas]MEC5290731.1 lytic transglycosylase domain-containing protein [Aurantimonas sp. C2-3-R2]MEC5380747.1 lytic transglycosylase domain-containing protein [Aurantimonas sp. C2-6-R+9]MEC5411796.1 lytic transglycosylase domain-containing protein [Aurantimonas sp. C2-4-R8]
MTAKLSTRRILISVLAVSMLPVSSFADEAILPLTGPKPTMRPMERAAGIAIDPARFGGAVRAPMPNPVLRSAAAPALPVAAGAFTASIAAMPRIASVRPMQGELKDGLQALSDRDPVKARAIREGMMPGSLDRDILAWAIALQGGKDVPAVEIARTATDLADWPGMITLRINSEKALYRERPPAGDVIRAFAGGQPESPEGAMALARAYIAAGDAGRARALIATVWREERLDKDIERALLADFQTLLSRADHKYRMDKLLYSDRVTDAGRVAGLAGAKELYAARAAVVRGDGNAGKLLAAVPNAQRGDSGYRFALVEYNRKKGKIDEAADLLVGAPRDSASLVDPDAWWNERRIVARDLLDLGQPKLAYRVASSHSAESPSEAVEAEFHAGWIALRFLNDPRTASQHFARIAQLSNKPLSLSRGYYWLGRAAEAGAGGNAANHYATAARYGSTYYGQLAAARLGRQPAAIAFPRPSDADRRRFEQRRAVRAIQRLQQIGSDWRTDSLYRALAGELDSPGELALLSVMAERRGDHALVLQVGKLANRGGVDAPALAFPIGVIPASANISSAGKALAYAIARQESAFNPKARSPAGALGLLQLMPGTAKSVARKAGLPYSAERLTSDPGYNATLGARFLGEQIADFGGSYVLTFVAYNAGPRRAREWIERFGDPRGKSLDAVIDWVERIPFTETRNYVQRIIENYQVYKMRLGASVDVERDLRFGRTG